MSQSKYPLFATYLSHLNLEANTEIPKNWNYLDKCRFVEVNGLSVTYIGEGNTDAEAASIRANSVVSEKCSIYYFEVHVVNRGRDGFIGVGYSTAAVPLSRLPGWEPNSFGYHGDDGFMFSGSGTGKPYGPSYTTGDIIGCCLNSKDKTIFFTKNGVSLGIAFRNVPRYLYPTVGLRTPLETVYANFGQEKFKFDIDSYVLTQKEFVNAQIRSKEFPNFHKMMLHAILDYLLTQGFEETAKALSNAIDENSSRSASKRNFIRQSILKADFDLVLNILSSTASSNGLFLVRCAKFIQNIVLLNQPFKRCEEENHRKSPKIDREIKDLIDFGHCVKNTPGAQNHAELLADVFSLLAYDNPLQSPVSYLTENQFLIGIAETVNEELLEIERGRTDSLLEYIFKTLFVTIQELGESDPIGSFINIRKDFMKIE